MTNPTPRTAAGRELLEAVRAGLTWPDHSEQMRMGIAAMLSHVESGVLAIEAEAATPDAGLRAALERLVAAFDYEDGSGRALENAAWDGCGWCMEYELPHEVGEAVRQARAALRAAASSTSRRPTNKP
jgi:hypothetical protein